MLGVEAELAAARPAAFLPPNFAESPCATNFRSDTTATAVGSPPAPAPRNAMSPPYWPEVTTKLRFLCTRPKGESVGTRQGPTSAKRVLLVSSAREIWRSVQPSSAA